MIVIILLSKFIIIFSIAANTVGDSELEAMLGQERR